MPRYVWLVMGAVSTLGLGLGTGYYWGSSQAVQRLLAHTEANEYAYQLRNGKYNFMMMLQLAQGHQDAAFSLAEGQATVAFTYFHYWPGTTDQERKLTQFFIDDVVDFYHRYPDRRKALAERPYASAELLTWLDSRP